MARVNIEECWWTDPRRSALASLVGGEEIADGAAIKVWRLGQEFWKHDRKLVPKQLFDLLRFASHLLQVGMVEVRGDEIYVRGSSAYLDWVNERKAAGRAGGVKKAQNRKKKAQNRKKEAEYDPESDSKDLANASKGYQKLPSSSSSASSSFSDSYSYSTSTSFLKKNELSLGVKECLDELKNTFDAFRIAKDPKTDEVQVARLVQIHGVNKTRLAIRGARFEPKTQTFDPAEHFSMIRLSEPKNFEKNVNRGSRLESAKDEELAAIFGETV